MNKREEQELLQQKLENKEALKNSSDEYILQLANSRNIITLERLRQDLKYIKETCENQEHCTKKCPIKDICIWDTTPDSWELDD